MSEGVESRAVHNDQKHRICRGDTAMEYEYAATYKIGNATVHVVAPQPQTEEEKDKIIKEYQRHFRRGWDLLPEEERLKINAQYKSEP